MMMSVPSPDINIQNCPALSSLHLHCTVTRLPGNQAWDVRAEPAVTFRSFVRQLISRLSYAAGREREERREYVGTPCLSPPAM